MAFRISSFPSGGKREAGWFSGNSTDAFIGSPTVSFERATGSHLTRITRTNSAAAILPQRKRCCTAEEALPTPTSPGKPVSIESRKRKIATGLFCNPLFFNAQRCCRTGRDQRLFEAQIRFMIASSYRGQGLFSRRSRASDSPSRRPPEQALASARRVPRFSAVVQTTIFGKILNLRNQVQMTHGFANLAAIVTRITVIHRILLARFHSRLVTSVRACCMSPSNSFRPREKLLTGPFGFGNGSLVTAGSLTCPCLRLYPSAS